VDIRPPEHGERNPARRANMKDYRSGTPRVACALVALTITALTFGLFVVVPADVESSGPGSATIAANQAIPPVTVVASLPEH
jgi:hypothetical protein